MAMKFEDLEAWQEARVVVRRVYALTRTSELKKDFGLCDQAQRSSVSVMTNIAEGFERVGYQEKLNFYNIARASAGETRSLLYVIEDNYLEQAAECAELRNDVARVGRKVTGLISSYKKRNAFVTIGLLFSLSGAASFLFALS
jgi:four helix bundle protein